LFGKFHFKKNKKPYKTQPTNYINKMNLKEIIIWMLVGAGIVIALGAFFIFFIL